MTTPAVEEQIPEFDALIASLFYLMSRHARLDDEALRIAISDHFGMLLKHPDCTSDILQKTSERLQRFWSEPEAEAFADECKTAYSTPCDRRLVH